MERPAKEFILTFFLSLNVHVSLTGYTSISIYSWIVNWCYSDRLALYSIWICRTDPEQHTIIQLWVSGESCICIYLKYRRILHLHLPKVETNESCYETVHSQIKFSLLLCNVVSGCAMQCSSSWDNVEFPPYPQLEIRNMPEKNLTHDFLI